MNRIHNYSEPLDQLVNPIREDKLVECHFKESLEVEFSSNNLNRLHKAMNPLFVFVIMFHMEI